MQRINPAELGPDQLFLSGKIQVETAIDVLKITGLNPEATQRLVYLLQAYEVLSLSGRHYELKYYIQGGSTAATKADIMASATQVARDEALPEFNRWAAEELLNVIG